MMKDSQRSIKLDLEVMYELKHVWVGAVELLNLTRAFILMRKDGLPIEICYTLSELAGTADCWNKVIECQKNRMGD